MQLFPRSTTAMCPLSLTDKAQGRNFSDSGLGRIITLRTWPGFLFESLWEDSRRFSMGPSSLVHLAPSFLSSRASFISMSHLTLPSGSWKHPLFATKDISYRRFSWSSINELFRCFTASNCACTLFAKNSSLLPGLNFPWFISTTWITWCACSEKSAISW